MIVRVALRTFTHRPWRTTVLACGFGLGVAVMACLLGVGEVILEQSLSPQLKGGGDVRIVGTHGALRNARFIMHRLRKDPQFASAIEAISPVLRRPLYLISEHGSRRIVARGGIPSREKALGDYETQAIEAWQDLAQDLAWTAPGDGDLLRSMDRFHAIPAETAWSDSWAEWLYFNGTTESHSFYLTFLVGARVMGADGTPTANRLGGVRLQLETPAGRRTFAVSAEIDAARLLVTAPDIQIGGNDVQLLEDGRYRIRLRLHETHDENTAGTLLSGELVLTPDNGANGGMPPYVVHGTDGWLSGYVVPVLDGNVQGYLTIDGKKIDFENAAGYHDHNWGFWRDVRWQWGQVKHDDVSIVYGRISPPAEAADPARLPGFLAIVQSDGTTGFAGGIRIEETDGLDGPETISVLANGPNLDLELLLTIVETIRGDHGGMDFLQMQADYEVRGRVAGQEIQFQARGATESWRGNPGP